MLSKLELPNISKSSVRGSLICRLKYFQRVHVLGVSFHVLCLKQGKRYWNNIQKLTFLWLGLDF